MESGQFYQGEKTLFVVEKACSHLIEIDSDQDIISIENQGVLHVTNYRVLWRLEVPAKEKSFNFEVSLPLGNIDGIKKIPKSKSKGVVGGFVLYCRNFRVHLFAFKEGTAWTKALDYITSRSLMQPVTEAFAFDFLRANQELSLENHGWEAFSSYLEYSRMGVPWNEFRLIKGNTNYQLCPSYMSQLPLPIAITDESLERAARTRQQNNFPVLSWSLIGQKPSIFRAGAPIQTTSSNINKLEDSKLIEFLYKMNPKGEKLRVVDIGPSQTWYAAAFPRASFLFLGLKNVLPRAGNNEQFFKAWIENLKQIFISTSPVIDIIKRGESVLVQEGAEGTDYLPLITSLAELLLDPFYRTIEGFAILIEKEWLGFGFPFQRKRGVPATGKKKEQASTVESYVFLQWLDAAWQVWRQFPAAFEYNEGFLLFIAQHLYDGLFGTFLFNDEKERKDKHAAAKTVSIWTYINIHRAKYLNPFYRQNDAASPSILIPNVAEIVLWKDFLCTWRQQILSFQWRLKYAVDDNREALQITENLENNSEMAPLEELKWSYRELNSISMRIAQMRNLKKLDLSHNHLMVLHEEFVLLLTDALDQLEDLDLSANHITKLPTSFGKFVKLHHLNLSHNSLSKAPTPVSALTTLRKLNLASNAMTQLIDIKALCDLEDLDLTSNLIATLPATFGHPKIRFLKISKNIITEIAGTFQFPELEELDLSYNRLTQVSIDLFNFVKTNLKILRISHNAIQFVPTAISLLQQLTEFEIEYNQLGEFPSGCVLLKNLKKLNVRKNKISRLPLDIYQLSGLTDLDLSKNELTSLPPSIGNMTQLKILDIAANKLSTLPPTLALLKDLEKFGFEQNELEQIPGSIISGGKASLFGFLNDLLKGSDKLHRMKIVVVGGPKVGKTSVCTNLRRLYRPASGRESERIPTEDQISIEQWPIVSNSGGQKQQDIDCSIWDFSDEGTAIASHHFFAGKRSIMYLLVWNASEPEEFTMIESWLQSIRSRAKESPVVLVGTHLDKLNSEVVSYIFTRVEKKFTTMFPSLQLHFKAVSCTTGDGFKKLRGDIEDLVIGSHIEERIPTSTLLLESDLQALSVKKIPPVITKAEFQLIASHRNIVDETELIRAAKTLHALSSITYFESDDRVNGHVILNAEWLIEAISSILLHPSEGILESRSLAQIWKSRQYPEPLYDFLLYTLENLEVLVAFAMKEASVVPMLLPSNIPKDVAKLWVTYKRSVSQNEFQLLMGRSYRFNFLPVGLIGKLLAALLNQNTQGVSFWRRGIFLNRSEGKELVMIQMDIERNAIEIIAKKRDKTLVNTAFLSEMIEILENILKANRLTATVYVICPHCIEEGFTEPYLFSLDECQTCAVTGKQILNCVHHDIMTPLHIDQLVPDMVMKEYGGYKISYSDLRLDAILGEGGAAIVYKGEWGDDTVAIKKLKAEKSTSSANLASFLEEQDSFSKAFSEFRREIQIMSCLEHPNLVKLKGLCLNPLCIVTEFMSGGDLYHFIHDTTKPLDWPLRVKIAIDIAAGMLYLHSAKPPIIHRDLKSPNVLMAALSADANIVAKVADFGLSGGIQTVSNTEVANPSWLAPEVMNKHPFTEASDVYSFGVILYELLTRKNFFEDVNFNSVIEQRVLKGERPEIPADCLVSYANLMRSCWAQLPQQRPPFKEIAQKLYFIKQEILLKFPHTRIGSASSLDEIKFVKRAGSDVAEVPEATKELSILEEPVEVPVEDVLAEPVLTSSNESGRLDSSRELGGSQDEPDRVKKKKKERKPKDVNFEDENERHSAFSFLVDLGKKNLNNN
eukprot:TRINITY_DN4943_c0_g1_i2.p1 TRINITY_DN4943_c0_g1~~TRINITY_DN4943_c0_g1_i2.p1  ORF type:complete len:1797 (+),score=541.41 TRINITY_DN4943_c0_g1_i2:200-5590(+)